MNQRSNSDPDGVLTAPEGVSRLDRVCGTGFAYEARIGFHEYERHIRQQIVVDFEAETDWRHASASDRPKSLVNYYEVNRAIEAMVARRQWRLIEAVAEDVAALICTRFPVHRVHVRVTKRPFDMPNAQAVAVECWRIPADFPDGVPERDGEPEP